MEYTGKTKSAVDALSNSCVELNNLRGKVNLLNSFFKEEFKHDGDVNKLDIAKLEASLALGLLQTYLSLPQVIGTKLISNISSFNKRIEALNDRIDKVENNKKRRKLTVNKSATNRILTSILSNQ